MPKAYIIDTKSLVLFILSISPLCQNEFNKCVSESNINKKVVEEEAKKLQREIMSQRAIVYITPQILAELSNWLEKYVRGEKLYKLMKEKVIDLLKKHSSEQYVKMNNILEEERVLIKFGFTDTSIYICSKNLNKDGKAPLITSDGELYNLCSNNSIKNILWR